MRDFGEEEGEAEHDHQQARGAEEARGVQGEVDDEALLRLPTDPLHAVAFADCPPCFNISSSGPL